MLRKMSSANSLFVPVEEKLMGLVIGTKGRNIKEIGDNTQTTITRRNGRESGFEVTGGTPDNREQAKLAIVSKMTSAKPLFVPVEKKLMGRVIGTNGKKIKAIEKKTKTRIRSRNGRESGFEVTGDTSDNREEAKLAIERSIVKSESKIFEVPKEYIKLVMGKERKNIDNIQMKSKTKITVLRHEEDEGGPIPLNICGRPANCGRAVSLIRQCIGAFKLKSIGYSSNAKFVCLDFKSEDEEFQLNADNDPPKLDAFIKGRRYRIETVIESESDSECEFESEIDNARTISKIEQYLLKSLQSLEKCKDKNELLVDLWCHFGKVLVANVDEEENKNVFKPADIIRRLKKKDKAALKDKNGTWDVSFEEGVKPLHINQDALPQPGVKDFGDLKLRLAHTQWRYDFGFNSPSERTVRLKVWQNLPSDIADGPPVEVKNILKKVILEADKSIEAWICHPSTTVLRGEIMIPTSRYDCRMKLRAGPRYAADKDNVSIEEDEILTDYLSHCKIDTEKHSMDLPDKNDHEIPKGFACTFYREAEERMYRTTFEDEEFLVIVLDQTGWDSDTSNKRVQKQFGVRVVMDAWSEELLSPNRNWNPKKILNKLDVYMKFLCFLQNHLF
ncbi:uncharacterized protein LOC114523221 [Dendronephthya gigantea]|uniref:uncharacterized protein LOC114523221 n=1 Tax=Dendronephthya gigantea TaxID=151771 RepID=UPI00106D9793|nr:uncharacterized protein LOC114523221 [Dendronephthya gigantea]